MKHVTLVILLALSPLSWGEKKELVIYCAINNEIASDQETSTAIVKLSGSEISFGDSSGTILYWSEEVIAASLFRPPENMSHHMFVKTGNDAYEYRMAGVSSGDNAFALFRGECKTF